MSQNSFLDVGLNFKVDIEQSQRRNHVILPLRLLQRYLAKPLTCTYLSSIVGTILQHQRSVEARDFERLSLRKRGRLNQLLKSGDRQIRVVLYDA